MRGRDAVRWIENQCLSRGDRFEVNYAPNGAVEVRVNDRFVFSFIGDDINFDAGVIVDAYEGAALRRPLPQREANPNDHLWHNELPPVMQGYGRHPPLLAPEQEAVEADLEVEVEEYARAVVARRMEWPDENNVVYHPSDSTHPTQEGEDYLGKSIINLVKTREGEVADSWIQNWNITGASIASGNFPLTYGFKAVMCKSKRHVIAEGVEFCEHCCWNCQTGDGSPFCASCRKAMRAEAGASVRSFASEHFPSLVPFLD